MGITSLARVLGVALAVCGCGASAPASAPAKPPPQPDELSRYLPLEDDTVLAFETTVESSGEKGVLMLQVHRPSGNLVELGVGGRIQRLEILPHAIRNLDGGFLLKAPLKRGATWQGMAGQVTVADNDKSVDVPAGHFQHCVETVEEKAVMDQRKRITTVFCPDVGIVVLDVEAQAGSETDKETARLRSHGKRVDLENEVPK